jgi:hypothetical protein
MGISPQLSYSSRFWANHLSDSPFDAKILDAIDKFFHTKFLYWLEVLSLLAQMGIASTALGDAANYVKARICPSCLHFN